MILLVKLFKAEFILVADIANESVSTEKVCLAPKCKAVKDNIISKIPLSRLGLPEDIASAVLFLASDGASYITGETLNINGGLSMI